MTVLPGVIAAVVAAFDAATTVEVLHGPSLVSVLPPNHLVVEVGENGGAKADRSRLEGMGRSRFRTDWSVGCMLVMQDGGSAIATLEAAAGAVIDDLDDALRDAGSTANWYTAGIAGPMSWGAVHTDMGCQVAVVFEVQGWSAA